MPTTGPTVVVLAGAALSDPRSSSTSPPRAHVQTGACLTAVARRHSLDTTGLGAVFILGAGPVARTARNTSELECLSHVTGDLGVGQAIGPEEGTYDYVASGGAQSISTTGPPVAVLAGAALFDPWSCANSTPRAIVPTGAARWQWHAGTLMDNTGLGALSILGAGSLARKVRNTFDIERQSHVIDGRGVGQAIILERKAPMTLLPPPTKKRRPPMPATGPTVVVLAGRP